MSEDMSEMMNKLSGMLNSDSLPDNVKEMLGSLKSSPNTENNSTPKDSASSEDSTNNTMNPEMLSNLMNMFRSNTNTNSSSDSSSSAPNIDMETIFKMKTVMEKMNQKDDPRSNLLLSLKPYLKSSRKDKIEQYVQLFNMTKVMDVLKPTGGDKSNDV